MADANAVALSFCAEASFGGALVGTELTRLRYVSESLGMDTAVVQSNEARRDGQVTDEKRVNINAAGDINIEWHRGSYDVLLAAALRSAGWSSAVTVSANDTISATASDNSINGTGLFGSFVVGQWVRVSGFTTAANNGFFKIATQTANKLTLIGGTLVDEAAGDDITVLMGPQIVNGTAKQSFKIEKHYQDLTTTYAIYNGMIPSGISMNAAVEALTTGTINFMGKDETSSATSAGSTYGAVNSQGLWGPIDEIDAVLFGQNTLATQQLRALTWNATNGLRARNVLQTLGPTSMGMGKFNITGTLQNYFESATLIDHYLNYSSGLALAFALNDEYLVEFPNIKFSAGRRVAGGVDTDVIADLSWRALMHPTELISMRVARFF